MGGFPRHHVSQWGEPWQEWQSTARERVGGLDAMMRTSTAQGEAEVLDLIEAVQANILHPTDDSL